MKQEGFKFYTDGSCKGNPGPGAWGFIIVKDGVKLKGHCGPSKEITTNNRMELTAMNKALLRVSSMDIMEVTIVSDSKYVLDGLTKWAQGWVDRGWKTSKGSKVKNSSLWALTFGLYKGLLSKGVKINLEWVKGHDGDEFNEQVDVMVQELAELNKLRDAN